MISRWSWGAVALACCLTACGGGSESDQEGIVEVQSEAIRADVLRATAGQALYVSTAGRDDAAGTQGAPLRTISRAAALAKPGTTVYVLAGTYYEQVVTQVAGLGGQPITFTSLGGPVIVDGSALPAEPDAGREQNRGVFELRHDWTVLTGIRIRNSPWSGVVLGASNLVVRNTHLRNIRRHGISTDTRYQPVNSSGVLSNIKLIGNGVTRSVTRGLGYGQAISLIADDFLVQGNEVWDNHTEGIDIWLGASNGAVVGNHVHHNVRTGIYLDGVRDVSVSGNTVHSNGAWTDGTVPGVANGHGIGIASEDTRYATTDVRVFNNLAWRNQRAGVFVWDQSYEAGYSGSRNVLIAHNTIVGNNTPFYFSDGVGNTGEVANNLYDGYLSRSVEMDIHDNVAVADPGIFTDAASGDYSLRLAAPAKDRGVAFRFPAFAGFTIRQDFNRTIRSGAPDAGAFEFGSVAPIARTTP